jgi:hypothetical protein
MKLKLPKFPMLGIRKLALFFFFFFFFTKKKKKEHLGSQGTCKQKQTRSFLALKDSNLAYPPQTYITYSCSRKQSNINILLSNTILGGPQLVPLQWSEMAWRLKIEL